MRRMTCSWSSRRSALLLAVALHAAGCHAIFPFDLPDDAGPDDVAETGDLVLGPDAPPVDRGSSAEDLLPPDTSPLPDIAPPDVAPPDAPVTADDAFMCAPGLTLCTGVCADLSSDPNHCGSCGTQCNPGLDCVGASCTCVVGGACPGCCQNATTCVLPAAQSVTLCGQGGQPCVACDDGKVCTKDVCSSGACSVVDEPSATPCNDGKWCTDPDYCENGACKGVPKVCPSGQCYVGQCNEAWKICDQLPVPAGQWCDDGDKCTELDTCNGTSCVGVQKCPVLVDECGAAGCDAATGMCISAVLKNDLAPCTDAWNQGVCCGGQCCPLPSVCCDANTATSACANTCR